MYSRLRQWLFRLDPERAHVLTLRLLQVSGAWAPVARILERRYAVPVADPIDAFGLRFPNRIGLAAGYDKDGLAWRGLAALGFGHIEIGTVTLRPQPGNPPPRLFRLVEDQALINRMGFPSRGADFVARRLRGPRPGGLVLGVNLGINKHTPLEQATEEYAALIDLFNPLADYLVVNVSSPNTPGLRQLEGNRRLAGLLAALAPHREKPLLVKLSPDMERADLESSLDVLMDFGIDGVVATNTTVGRPPLSSPQAAETGGLSGAPLAQRARGTVAAIHRYSKGGLPIIAAGGIMDAADATAALGAGASLVQVYTGLVYRGPGLLTELIRATTRTCY